MSRRKLVGKDLEAKFGVFTVAGEEISRSDGNGNGLMTAPSAQNRAADLMARWPDYGTLHVRPLKEISI